MKRNRIAVSKSYFRKRHGLASVEALCHPFPPYTVWVKRFDKQAPHDFVFRRVSERRVKQLISTFDAMYGTQDQE